MEEELERERDNIKCAKRYNKLGEEIQRKIEGGDNDGEREKQ